MFDPAAVVLIGADLTKLTASEGATVGGKCMDGGMPGDGSPPVLPCQRPRAPLMFLEPGHGSQKLLPPDSVWAVHTHTHTHRGCLLCPRRPD